MQSRNNNISVSKRERQRTAGSGPQNEMRDWTSLVLTDLTRDSKFFEENPPANVPTLHPTDVKIGSILGRGDFGVVFEVADLLVGSVASDGFYIADNQGTIIDPPHSIIILPEEPITSNTSPTVRSRNKSKLAVSFEIKDTQTTTTAVVDQFDDNISEYDDLTIIDESTDKPLLSQPENSHNKNSSPGYCIHAATLAAHCMRNGVARYAVKRICDSVDPKVRVDAAMDLACEAKFLQCIAHSNIVHLRAIVGIPGTPEFAIIMDRLTMTLSEKIHIWSEEKKKARGTLGLFKKDKQALQELFLEQLVVSFDIARALRHLHSKKILYRDLKPENIGFDVREDARIFDFGLARELKDKDLVKAPDQYNITGLTGSRRYMAPEVIRCVPYGLSADVFSFAILFWQIFSLKMPFRTYDAAQHFQHVVEDGKRPARLINLLPKSLHSMMERAWDDDPVARPQMTDICESIHGEIYAIKGTSSVSVTDRSQYLRTRSFQSLNDAE